MSVITHADESLDKAKENINKSIQNISDIVIDKVWDSEEYTKEYFFKLQSILNTLITIREKL